MKKNDTRIAALFSAVCLFLSAMPADSDVRAVEADAGYRSLTALIPDAAAEYVGGIFPEVCDAAVSFARELEKDDSLTYELELGEPYIVYHFSEYQDEVYYYPLISDGRVEFILGIIGTDEGYTYDIATGGEMRKLLNELDYPDNECIFYVIDDELYYETKNGEETDFDVGAVYGIDGNPERAERLFSAKTFEEKQRIIAEKAGSFRPVGLPGEDLDGYDDIRYGEMITLRRPQKQYDTKMCWACVVATIVNTLNWTYYTGYDICNRMGIGFYTGADIEDMRQALSYYGISYQRRDDALSWIDMKKNIDAEYPVAVLTVNTARYSEGHTVTLMGYKEEGGKRYMYIWDSQDNVCKKTVVPNMEVNYHILSYGSYMVFSDDSGDTYLWIQTLSKY